MSNDVFLVFQDAPNLREAVEDLSPVPSSLPSSLSSLSPLLLFSSRFALSMMMRLSVQALSLWCVCFVSGAMTAACTGKSLRPSDCQGLLFSSLLSHLWELHWILGFTLSLFLSPCGFLSVDEWTGVAKQLQLDGWGPLWTSVVWSILVRLSLEMHPFGERNRFSSSRRTSLEEPPSGARRRFRRLESMYTFSSTVCSHLSQVDSSFFSLPPQTPSTQWT